jgi:hypothetical protein
VPQSYVTEVACIYGANSAAAAAPWLLAGVAIGLIMFGLFSCCQARWRRF